MITECKKYRLFEIIWGENLSSSGINESIKMLYLLNSACALHPVLSRARICRFSRKNVSLINMKKVKHWTLDRESLGCDRKIIQDDRKKNRARMAIASLRRVLNLYTLNKHFIDFKDGSGPMLVILRDDSLTMLLNRTQMTRYVWIFDLFHKISSLNKCILIKNR